MVEKTEAKAEAKTQPKGVIAKIAYLADLLKDAVWKKDGVNASQKYKYISESQYKAIHGEAVAKAGLIFKYSILDRTFTPNITDKMHLVTIKVQIEYIDPETGERETYITYGDGADSGDKGLYKAETGAYKYHIATNFHVAENNDPELDTPTPKGKGVFQAGGTFQTPEQIKAAKEEVLGGDLASAADVKKLTEIFKEYEALFPDKAATFRAGNPDFSKIKAVAIKAMLPNITKAVESAKNK